MIYVCNCIQHINTNQYQPASGRYCSMEYGHKIYSSSFQLAPSSDKLRRTGTTWYEKIWSPTQTTQNIFGLSEWHQTELAMSPISRQSPISTNQPLDTLLNKRSDDDQEMKILRPVHFCRGGHARTMGSTHHSWTHSWIRGVTTISHTRRRTKMVGSKYSKTMTTVYTGV